MEFKPVLESHIPVHSNIVNTHRFMILKCSISGILIRCDLAPLQISVSLQSSP